MKFKNIKTLKINKPRLITSVSFLLLAFLSSSYFIFFRPSAVSAAWWNDSWPYRKPVPVTNSAAAQNSVYVQATIDTSDTSRFNVDCGDLRFTDVNGNLLPYYIVSGCRTAGTVVNVYFENLIAGASTFYYYYGNPSAGLAASLTNFTAVASSYAIGAIGAEEKGTGPAAYWSFDDGSGTVVQDESSNNNDGALANMSAIASSTSGWQTEDACVSGKCLAFDGGDDYVTMGNKSAYDFSGDFSINFWIKTKQADWKTIIGKHTDYGNPGGTGTGWAMYPHSGINGIRGYFRNGSTNALTDIPHANDGQWHYLSFSRSGSQLSYYKDGKNVGVVTIAGSLNNSINLTIGTGYQYFNGRIDEPKIYNYARSAAQIKMDYNAGLAGTSGRAAAEGVSVSAGSRSAKWLADGLVGWWKMDEAAWNGTANEVADYSGNGNNGVAAGTTGGTASTTAGKFGNGGSFDGVDDYVNMGANSNFNFGTGNFTVSVWFKRDGDSPSDDFGGAIIGNGGYGGLNAGYTIYVSDDGDILSSQIRKADDTRYNIGNYVITNGNWYHAVLVRNATDRKINFYVNGNLADSAAETSILDISTANSFRIGNLDQLALGGSDREFDGNIDDVRIYNRALSDREVRDLYFYAPGPVGWWKMEEGSGQYAYDVSGNSNLGTLGPSTTADSYDPSWSEGKFGKGLKFDGINDNVKINSVSRFNKNSGTVEVWFKRKSISSAAAYIFAHPSVNDSRIYIKYDASGDQVHCNLGDGTGIGSNYTIINNQWNHFACSWDGTAGNFYANGISQGSGNFNGLATMGSAYIGGFSDNTQVVNGTVDDVKIYDYARTAEQIREDMQARGMAAEGGGATAAVSASGKTAVGYWKFEEGAGTLAHDSSGNKNDGLIYPGLTGNNIATSSLWDKNGKFGGAMEFDGADDWVKIPDNNSLSFGNSTLDNPFTLSAYINLRDATSARIAQKGTLNSGKGEYGFITRTNDALAIFSYDESIDSCYMGRTTNPITNFENQWIHVVGVYDGSATSAGFKIYINGQRADVSDYSSACAYVAMENSDDSLHIGEDGIGGYANGLIDEVKIYNFALTPEDVKAEYNDSAGLKLGSFSNDANGVASSSAASLYCVPGSTDPCAPPVGEWKFEEASGQTAYDTSGNGYNGTLGSGATADAADPIYAAGKTGKGLKFGNGDYATINDNAILRPGTGNFTVSLWIKTPFSFTDIGDSSWPNIFLKGLTTSAPAHTWGFLGSASSNNAIFYGQSSDAGSAWDVNLNTGNLANGWHHIIVRRSGTTVQIYVDGKYVSEDTSAGSDLSTASNFYIGGNTANTSYFIGQLDEIKYYNYARTPAQIAWDYNRGGPTGRWKLDEGQGGMAYDSSGKGNKGLVYPGMAGTQTATSTMWSNGASGKRNGSLNFDGTDDYVTIPDSASLDFGAGDFSLAAWIKVSSAWAQDNTKRIIDRSSGNIETGIGYYGNQARCLLRDATDGTSVTVDSGVTLSDNQWHHIICAFDRDSSTGQKIYIDGVLKNSGNPAGENGSLDMAAPLVIGGEATQRYFSGQIDDVQIFNYALTAQQAKTLNAGGAGRFGQ